MLLTVEGERDGEALKLRVQSIQSLDEAAEGLQRGLKVVLDGRAFQADSRAARRAEGDAEAGRQGHRLPQHDAARTGAARWRSPCPAASTSRPRRRAPSPPCPACWRWWIFEGVPLVYCCLARRGFLTTRRAYAASAPRSECRAGCSRDPPTASARCMLTTELVVFEEATVADSSTRLRPPSFAR